MSAALDGGTAIMIFVWTFAVGGAGGKTVAFPTWALVRLLVLFLQVGQLLTLCNHRILLETRIIVNV